MDIENNSAQPIPDNRIGLAIVETRHALSLPDFSKNFY
jgi:hypothetical protein